MAILVRHIALAVTLLLASVAATAVPVDEPLPDPAKEAEARALMKQLRCFVCQNQSIEDSNADLARDLRALVRERIAAGDSPDEIKAYLVERYGDWVLMSPPVNERTIWLWAGPFLLLLGVATVIVIRARRRPDSLASGLTAEEEARVQALLDDSENDTDDRRGGPRA